jgi:signal transduction histidine kinase
VLPRRLLLVVGLVLAVFVLVDVLDGTSFGVELLELPLIAALFMAMVSQARSRQHALEVAGLKAAENAALVEHQERFLQDVSHQLRTPITIARGHLELARPQANGISSEIGIALEELARVEVTLARLLRLAKARRPDFLTLTAIDLESFVEDVFLRWSELAPRAWRLDEMPPGTLVGDLEVPPSGPRRTDRERGQAHLAARQDRAPGTGAWRRAGSSSRSPTAETACRRRCSTGSSTGSPRPGPQDPSRSRGSVSGSRSWTPS